MTETRDGLPESFQRIVPALSRAEIEARVDAFWELVDGVFPVPRDPDPCPSCGSPEIQLSRINYALKVGEARATLAGRADVGFKCTECSRYWTHGVPIPEDVYREARERNPRGSNLWWWRDIRTELLYEESPNRNGRDDDGD